MNPLKRALIEVEKLLQYYIQIADEIDSIDLKNKEIKSIQHIVKALDKGCFCSTHIDYDCGCETRSSLRKKSLKQLQKLKNQLN